MPSVANVMHGHFLIAAGLVALVTVIVLAWRVVRRRRSRQRGADGAGDNSR
jgi:hypothetical protein